MLVSGAVIWNSRPATPPSPTADSPVTRPFSLPARLSRPKRDPRGAGRGGVTGAVGGGCSVGRAGGGAGLAGVGGRGRIHFGYGDCSSTQVTVSPAGALQSFRPPQ